MQVSLRWCKVATSSWLWRHSDLAMTQLDHSTLLVAGSNINMYVINMTSVFCFTFFSPFCHCARPNCWWDIGLSPSNLKIPAMATALAMAYKRRVVPLIPHAKASYNSCLWTIANVQNSVKILCIPEDLLEKKNVIERWLIIWLLHSTAARHFAAESSSHTTRSMQSQLNCESYFLSSKLDMYRYTSLIRTTCLAMSKACDMSILSIFFRHRLLARITVTAHARTSMGCAQTYFTSAQNDL